MKLKQTLVCLLAIVLTSQVNAHSRWLLPSHFSLSSDKGEWITVDVTASNEMFNADKSLSTKPLRILTPKGEVQKPDATYKARRKGVADFFIQQGGTYKLTNNTEPRYFTGYMQDGKRQWEKGHKAQVKLPKNVTDIETGLWFSRIETYVTMNAPSDNYATEGKFLELVPTTHPSEIVEQEPVEFTFTYHGKAAEGVQIEVMRDGQRYRNSPETLNLTSNKQGQITFTPPVAGRYLLIAEYEQAAANTDLADKEHSSVFLTFEAQLQ